MLEDRLLVLRCRRGSQEAMRHVYLKYKDHLLTLARGLLGEQAEAEDVMHDVFVRFAESIERFRLTGSLRGYLATCTANLARDRIRAKRRRAEGPEPGIRTGGPDENPEKLAVATEQQVRLEEALAALPYEQREAVLLHLKAQMTFGDIAKVQDVSLSTAHGRYRYGLDKLRSLLNSESDQ